ncbi:hypothetical protein Y032_0420g1137 [Ancylostoma ceylanicum]|uniref:Uncharacterized protein n=1 Tax=Ancylostoma ceylanicum TaxID=53326 RepID=A0A016X346_9BILA|nr:hypothetical protein Y032_0420g1137 [Ancylostoma ceylanicum]
MPGRKHKQNINIGNSRQSQQPTGLPYRICRWCDAADQMLGILWYRSYRNGNSRLPSSQCWQPHITC